MNINDVDSKGIPSLDPTDGDDWLTKIFQRQQILHDKYKTIEHESGIGLSLIQNRAFSIDDKTCQYVIKDFAWRVTEEIAEAAEAYDAGNEMHFLEEVIDALHFYTELLILVGIGPADLSKPPRDSYKYQTPGEHMFNVIQSLGLSMNTLKQKPWKQHHFPTDRNLFHSHITRGYWELLWLLFSRELRTSDIYEIYYKKSEVNRFRQRSNY